MSARRPATGDVGGTRPVVSVIIVSWNTRDLLRECLKTVLRETQNLACEVLVVDNASEDGTVEMLAGEFPHVRVTANPSNRGFAAANNQALSVAQGRYCLLLNPDTLILDRAIERAVSFAEHHPQHAVVGCQVMEDENTIQRTCFSFPSAWGLLLDTVGLSAVLPRSRVFGRGKIGWWDRTTEREVDVVSGMFMLVRRDAIVQVGLMDEDYFVYAEETDWCFRFWRAGWRCVFTPQARIIHLDGGGKSTSQVSVKMFVQTSEEPPYLLPEEPRPFDLADGEGHHAARRLASRDCLVGGRSRHRRQGFDPQGRAILRGPAVSSLWRVPAMIDGDTTSRHRPALQRRSLDCRIIDSFDSPLVNRDEWDAFVSSVSGDIYMTFDWCRVWWQHYGAGRRLRVLIYTAEQKIVGIVPLFVDTIWIGPTWLRVAKIVGGDYSLQICDPPVAKEWADSIFRHLADRVFSEERCDAVHVGPVPSVSMSREAMRNACLLAPAPRPLLRDRAADVGTVFNLPESFEELSGILWTGSDGAS